jgi:hypothetical protein
VLGNPYAGCLLPVETPTFGGFLGWVEQMEPQRCLLHATLSAPTEEAIRFTKDRDADGITTVARSGRFLVRTPAPAVLPLDVDHDAADALGLTTHEAVVELVRALMPEATDSPVAVRGSVSSGIALVATGELLLSHGRRAYVPLRSGVDIPTWLDALEARAIRAGIHWHKITENGVLLVRGPFDQAMKKITQPDFCAAAVLGAGLVQAPRLFEVYGDVDGPAAKLSKQARQDAKDLPALAAGLKETLLATRAIARKVDAARAAFLADKAATIGEEAARSLAGADGETITLPPETPITTARFGTLPFGELVVRAMLDRKSFNRALAKDPLEPNYRTSAWPASVLASGVNLAPVRLFSHAHGIGRSYVLDAAEAIRAGTAAIRRSRGAA